MPTSVANRPTPGVLRSAVDLAQPARLRWTGFGGVCLLTAAAWTGVSGAVTLSLVAGVTGIGLLVLSWASLGRALPSVRWLRSTLVLWCGPLLVAPVMFSRDVFSYLAQGEIAARGLDVHTVSPLAGLGATSESVERVGVYWRDTPSPYGSLFGAVERLIAQVSAGDPVVGILGHRLVAVLGLAMIVWAVPRLARIAGAAERTALWLGVLNPLVLWHLVAGVHNDALMLGFMLSGTAIALAALGKRIEWRPLLSGVALIALGAQVKLPAVVALAVVGTALARRRRGTVGDLVLVGVAMVVVFAVVSVVVSFLTRIGPVPSLGTSGLVNSWMAPTNWFGFLAGAALGAQVTQTMIGVGKAIGSVLMVCGIMVVLHRQLRGRVDAVASLGMMLGVAVLCGPVVQPWYLLWAVIPLACAPLGRFRTRLTALVAVFAVLVPPLAGNHSGQVPQLVACYATGIALAFLVMATCWKRSQISGPNRTGRP